MGLTPRQTLVVPDPQSWAVWGLDLRGAGLEPAVAAEQARALLLPARVPAPLTGAAREAAGRIPGDIELTVRPAPLEGSAARLVLSGPVLAPGGGQSGDGSDGHDTGDGDGDMMAIVGEPSADGLIMEDVGLVVGPLAPGLPGGLVARLTLDGDVVAGARIEATLAALPGSAARGLAPDPLAGLAWRAVVGRARGARTPRSLAALEVERALSHAAWLSALAAVLGHARLGAVSARAVAALVAVRAAVLPPTGSPRAAGPDPHLVPTATTSAAVGPVEALHTLCAEDRGLRMRLAGLGVTDPAELTARRVGGPVARAAGLGHDARTGDPAYAAADFRPVLAERGDALARTRVRAAEASAALELATALLDRSAPGGHGGRGPDASPEFDGSGGRVAPLRPAVVEGPRGPLHAVAAPNGTPAVAAPGHSALLALAGRAMCGLELASAMAVLVSFDLSPWRVGP